MHLLRTAFIVVCNACLLWAQAPPTGTVVGGVFDSANGQPVRQALITVEGQPNRRAVSDTDGKFRLEIPVGKYKLRFNADNYTETTVDEVVVVAGQSTEASTVMANKANVTTVDVVEKIGAVAATAEAALTERRLSGSVSDSISTEELRGGVASDAAGAVEKATGVSIVDNGFVYVRGLGERYSATMLNMAMIPTTEPEKRVVPLDLFPAALIDNIKILKTYTPDLPGEFAGGLVQMNTVEFPTQNMFRASISTGLNTMTTFDNFLSHRGGSSDVFGFDRGSRNLPSAIPAERRIFPGSFSESEVQSLGRSFENNWEPENIGSMRPTQSYSLTGGGTFGRFGIVGALSFTNRPQRYQEEWNYLRNAGGNQPVIFTSYPDFRDNAESARLGGVLNIAMRLNQTNKVVFRNTLTRDTDKETRFLTGYAGTIDSTISSERLRFIERGILSSSVEGEHSLSRLRNSILRWQFTYSTSSRNEPDLREVVRGLDDSGQFLFLNRPESGLRFFNDLNDKIYEPQVEIGTPFYKGNFSGMFKFGFRATLRDRNFNARRFRFNVGRDITFAQLALPSNQLFADERITPTGFNLREVTRGTDRYDATMDVYGGYGMLDLAIGPKWRIVGGIRFEDADITVTTVDPLVPGANPAVARLNNRDPLPGINVIYQATPRQNIRVGYSRTLSRPDFRELSPFEFTNVVGGFNTVGNPNLLRATIQNFDARWEYFPGGDQLIAVSYFFKNFKDPIETSIQAVADKRQSFLNADGARNQGIELEFRRSLSLLNPRLRDFAVGTNFTFVDSNVELPEAEGLVLTSTNRPLVGQSRFIYNVIADWRRPQWRSNARFYVNSVSRRITDVGTFGLPDIYQERNTFIDAVYQYDIRENGSWSLRFAAENLGDNEYRWTQADINHRRFRLGRTFTVGTSFSLF
ncbi:MAG TPA: TonB-dependent receptor [Bryobacteraceae bacterium]|nr:TonB-dependent receptor [Bryobacteraceae bacterium]